MTTRIVAALAIVMVIGGCATTPQQTPTRDPQTPMFKTDLPARPDATKIAPEQDWVIAVETGDMIASAGICMSEQKAMRAANYVVSYNELRGLYEVDLKTMDRERQVYEKELEIADQEIAALREEARRSWWERHGASVTMVIGLVAGAGFAVGMAAALDGVTE